MRTRECECERERELTRECKYERKEENVHETMMGNLLDFRQVFKAFGNN